MTLGTVLVTGGAGYIGSHACKALAGAGFLPVTLDNLERGHDDAVKWGPLVVADLRDAAAVAGAIAEHRPRAAMHFAAYAYVGESVKRPDDYLANNVGGTANLVEACRAAAVEVLVFSSSCATYGTPATLPITEAMAQEPINPYGRTKLLCEQVLAAASAAGSLRYTALRYFNAAGADPDGELAERHDPEPHLIPRALLAAAGLGPPLDVFGDDYPTRDGTCIRDYVHVTDLADAHVAALRRLLDGAPSGAFNLGTGVGISVREIIAAVEKVTGRSVPHRISARRPGDPPELVADPGEARRVLGFVPRHSDLATIIATAARIHQPAAE